MWTQCESWGILSLGPANYWLITSSDAGHSQSQCQIWTFSSSLLTEAEPKPDFGLVAELHQKSLSWDVLEWALQDGVGGGGVLKWHLHTDDSSIKPGNEKWAVSPYLYTNMHGSAADFQCLHFYHPIRADVWSYCYTKWFLHLLHIKHWSGRKSCHRVHHLTNI